MQWRFINPLLECDAAEDLIRRPELVSFKRQLVDLVETRRAAGEIMSASIYFRELIDGLLNAIVTLPEQGETLLGLGVLPELIETQGKLDVKTVSSFLRVLYNAFYLSREHSEAALEMLSHSSFRDGVIGGVPAGVPVCSKYGKADIGENIVQLHEFAIVYYERRPYLLGVMTQGRDFTAMACFIRNVSRTVYEGVDWQTHAAAGADLPPGLR